MSATVVDCLALTRGGFWVTYRDEEGSSWSVIEEYPPPGVDIEGL